jgi:hypothetical protein
MLPGSAEAQPPGHADSAPTSAQSIPIAVIDIRSPSREHQRERQRITELVRGSAGVTALADAGLAAALAGSWADRDAAEDELESAANAFGRLDCSLAGAHAHAAALRWAAVQARGGIALTPLRQAHSYAFLCGDRQGDIHLAMASARVLRALGGPRPPHGINEAEWKRYPELDATANVPRTELTVVSEPRDADLWIDYVRVGTTPLTVFAEEGAHVVAAGKAGVSSVVEVDLHGPSHRVELTLPDGDRWTSVRKRVAAYQTRTGSLRNPEIGELLAAAGVRGAILLRRGSELEVWGATRGRGALPLGNPANLADAARIIIEHVAAADRGPAIDPNLPLMREDPRGGRSGERPSWQQWWVYAALAGAAAIGAGVILAHDLATDHQRIEVTFP